MGYFWTPNPIGLNADIERHRAKRKELEAKIAELESEAADGNPMRDASLRTYRHFLYQLELSYAEVVTKLGK